MLYNNNNLNITKIASKNENRPELTGVFFKSDKTVATDTFRLIEMSTPSNVKPEDYPKLPSGKTAMRGCKPFIVSAKELSKIKIPNNKTLPIVNHLAIGHVDDQRVELLTTDLETEQVKSLRRIDGNFPDYEKLFPVDKPIAEVELNADYLSELLNIMGKLNNLKSVKIKFHGPDKPLVLEASGPDQKARGMLMLLRK